MKGKAQRGIRKKMLMALAVLLIAMAAGCFAFVLLYGPSFGVYLRRPSPKRYGEIALGFLENGYYTKTQEWQQVKEEVRQALEGAKSYEDTWPHLEKALRVAGGKHSRLVTALEEAEEEGEQKEIPMPEVGIWEENPDILIIKIPECTLEGEKAKEYANLVLSFLSEHRQASGVVLDLRGNRGGDLAPMIGALSPLLPEGDILGIKMVSGQVRTLTLKEGVFVGGGGIQVDSFKLPEGLPIAILTDEETGSSGEAVLLAFRGLENTRSFGRATAGYASANTVFSLYDGTELILSVGADVAMRTGEEFCEDPIEPDVPCEDPRQEALSWILEQVGEREEGA